MEWIQDALCKVRRYVLIPVVSVEHVFYGGYGLCSYLCTNRMDSRRTFVRRVEARNFD